MHPKLDQNWTKIGPNVEQNNLKLNNFELGLKWTECTKMVQITKKIVKKLDSKLFYDPVVKNTFKERILLP